MHKDAKSVLIGIIIGLIFVALYYPIAYHLFPAFPDTTSITERLVLAIKACVFPGLCYLLVF